MSRVLPFLAVLFVVGCDGEFVQDSGSVTTDPTTEFEIEIPNDGVDNDGDGIIDESMVDSGWPSYNGGRRRSLESGWRRVPGTPTRD